MCVYQSLSCASITTPSIRSNFIVSVSPTSAFWGEAITLVFYSIPQHFIRDTCAKFGIPNLPQSPDIWENSHRGISDFWISGLSPIKENCHNSRTSNDIDMNVGLVTKLGKRNTAMPK